jgi:hypothetical protein
LIEGRRHSRPSRSDSRRRVTTTSAGLRRTACRSSTDSRPLRSNRASSSTPARCGRSLARGTACLTGERPARRGLASFASQCAADGTGPRPADSPRSTACRAPPCAPCRCSASPRGTLRAFRRVRQVDACATRLRQPDGNGLLRRARAVFPLTDVVHFLADEFARLRRWRLAGSTIPSSAFERGFLWHEFQLLYIGYPDLIGHAPAGSVPARSKGVRLRSQKDSDA